MLTGNRISADSPSGTRLATSNLFGLLMLSFLLLLKAETGFGIDFTQVTGHLSAFSICFGQITL
jgi:hypothetical protein